MVQQLTEHYATETVWGKIRLYRDCLTLNHVLILYAVTFHISQLIVWTKHYMMASCASLTLTHMTIVTILVTITTAYFTNVPTIYQTAAIVDCEQYEFVAFISIVVFQSLKHDASQAYW
jgi:hypothetical protein